MSIISIRNCIVHTDIVNKVTCMRESNITRVVIQFLWHDVIHWVTAMSHDKQKYWIMGYGMYDVYW